MAPCVAASPRVPVVQETKVAQSTTSGMELRGMELSGIELRGMELSGMELSGMELSGLLARLIELSGMELNGIELRGIELRGMELSGIELRGTPARASVSNVTPLSEVGVIPRSEHAVAPSTEHHADIAEVPLVDPLIGIELRVVAPRAMELSGMELRGLEARLRSPRSTVSKLAAGEGTGSLLTVPAVVSASTSARGTASSGNPEDSHP